MIALQSILVIISETCRVEIYHIRSNSRRAEVVDARSLYIYFGHLNGYTTHQISELFANNRKCIQYNLERVRRLVTVDKNMRRLYADCSLAVKSFKSRFHITNKYHR